MFESNFRGIIFVTLKRFNSSLESVAKRFIINTNMISTIDFFIM